MMNGGFVEAAPKWLVVVLVKFSHFIGIRLSRLAVVCELDLSGIPQELMGIFMPCSQGRNKRRS